MSKDTILHQIIAAEPDEKKNAYEILRESAKVFSDKPNLFMGYVKTGRWFDDIRNETEPFPPEELKVFTTVGKRINYTLNKVTNFWNTSFMRAIGNASSTADVIVDDKVIIENAPVTFLLDMETYVAQYLDVLRNIPTLDSSKSWQIEENGAKEGVFITEPEITYKTEKQKDFPVIVQPTEHHPAHVETVVKDINVGVYEKVHKSGMISSSKKNELIEKAQKLLRAVKFARQKANTQKVETSDYMANVYEYLSM